MFGETVKLLRHYNCRNAVTLFLLTLPSITDRGQQRVYFRLKLHFSVCVGVCRTAIPNKQRDTFRQQEKKYINIFWFCPQLRILDTSSPVTRTQCSIQGGRSGSGRAGPELGRWWGTGSVPPPPPADRSPSSGSAAAWSADPLHTSDYIDPSLQVPNCKETKETLGELAKDTMTVNNRRQLSGDNLLYLLVKIYKHK